jgi:hypothetical protein
MYRMKKSAIALFGAAFLIAIVLVGAVVIGTSRASGAAIISVDPATQQFPSAQVGDVIQVNVTVSNVQNLWAWDLVNTTFNPSVLNLTQVSEGPFLKQAGSTFFLWTSESTTALRQGYVPEISCALLENSSVTGSGVIATLSFQVISWGTSQITFNQTTLLDPSQGQISVTAGNVNIILPEFPISLGLVLLIFAATVSILFVSKKVKQSRK